MITTRKGFKGLSDLSKSIQKLTEPDLRRKILTSSGKVAMDRILKDAKSNAPVLSPENVPKNKKITAGTLKNSIKYRGSFSKQPVVSTKGKNKNKVTPLSKHEYVGRVSTGKEAKDFAIALEYGREEYTVLRIHVFGMKVNPYEATMIAMKPNPFMRKALDDNKDYAVNKFVSELKLNFERFKRIQANRIKRRNK